MKILHLNTYFQLPDSFEGDVNDAIEELLKYRKEKKLSSFKLNEEPAKDWDDMTQPEKWNYFCEAIKDGYKHVGHASFSEFADGDWNKL